MTNDEFFQRFEVLTDAPNGIAKLRALILQLAVRGKLVAQDSNDEPASVLLEKIMAEKERLVTEGRTKKTKPLPPIEPEEVPFGAPLGWVWVRFNDIVDPATPVSYGILVPGPDVPEGIPFVRLGDLAINNPPTTPIKRISPEIDKQYERTRLVGGEILMGVVGSIGKLGLAPDSWCGANIARAVCRIRVLKSMDKRFVIRLLQSKMMQSVFHSDTRTLAQPTLNIGLIRIALAPLPPAAEQTRIVAKVDQLMALCDELKAKQNQRAKTHGRLIRAAHQPLTQPRDHVEFQTAWQRVRDNFAGLHTTVDSVKALRQTILQLAVQGKLVPQDPNDEPASVLLEKLRVEKERLVAEGKIRKTKLLPDVDARDVPCDLPEGWVLVRFGNVVSMRLGKMLDKGKNKGTLRPYLRNTNLQWQRFDLSDVKQMRIADQEQDEYRVKDGDLLLCEGGEPGRCAIWHGELSEVYFQKAIHRVRSLGGISAQFLLYRILSDTQSGFLATFYTGATIKHLTGKALSVYFLAMPPVSEQYRIVAKVGQLMARCDKLEAKIKANQTTAQHFAEAVVAELAA